MNAHQVRPQTFALVAAVHVLIITFFCLSYTRATSEPPKVIDLVSIPFGSPTPGPGKDIKIGGSHSGGTPSPGPVSPPKTPAPPSPPTPAPQQPATPVTPTPPTPEPPAAAPTHVSEPTPTPEMHVKHVKTPPPEKIKSPSHDQVQAPKHPSRPVVHVNTDKLVERHVSESQNSSTEKTQVKTPSSGKPTVKNPGVKPVVDGDGGDGGFRKSLEFAISSVGVQGPDDGPGGPAGSPNGDSSEKASYRALIGQTIKEHWHKPPFASRDHLATSVQIRISPDGSVHFVGISSPSGDSGMDDSVRQAVESVSKISRPLPAGMGNPDYEVVVNFTLK